MQPAFYPPRSASNALRLSGAAASCQAFGSEDEATPASALPHKIR